jgi:ribonuclease-3
MAAAQRSFQELLPESLRSDPLLDQALTHRSAGPRNNERLEFLGDAVLGLVIADLLFQRVPDRTEGDLTRLRAALVNRRNLAMLAQRAGLAPSLRLGEGERKSGGQRRESILADVLEAVIGACYLQAGFAATQGFVASLFAEQLADLPEAESLKDPKTRLQELTQKRGMGLPTYEVLAAEGPDHARTFTVKIILPGIDHELRGQGSSRRNAEQTAAATAVAWLQSKGRE